MINNEFDFDESTRVYIAIDEDIYKDYEWIARYEYFAIKTNVTIVYGDDAISKEITIESTPDWLLDNPSVMNNTGECVMALTLALEEYEEFCDFIEDYRYSKDKECTCGDPNDCVCLDLLFEDNIEVKVEAVSFEITDNSMNDMLVEFNDIARVTTKKEEIEDILKIVNSIREEWSKQLASSETLAERIIPKRFFNQFSELYTEILRAISELDSIFEKIKEINFSIDKIYSISQRRGSWVIISSYDYIEEDEKNAFWNNQYGIYSCEMRAIEVIDDKTYKKNDTFEIYGEDLYIDEILNNHISKYENLIAGIIIIKDKIGKIEIEEID